MMPGNGNRNRDTFTLRIAKVLLEPVAYERRRSCHVAIDLRIARMRLESIQAQLRYILPPIRVELFKGKMQLYRATSCLRTYMI